MSTNQKRKPPKKNANADDYKVNVEEVKLKIDFIR